MIGKTRLLCGGCVGFAVLAAGTACAQAQDQIVVTAPSESDTMSIREAPGNAQVLRGDPLTRQNPSNLADLLNDNLGSVSIGNGSGSPYQNDVSYRGFQATSLLGAATGLSVYMDGVGMNEPFGANVNWDLIPMNALSSVEVLPGSNPVFGLNTLGGALVLTMKNGADDGGLSAMAEGGSFNRWHAQAQAGGTLKGGAFDWFVAGNYDRQDGWRRYTSQRVEQAYGKLRWHGAHAHAELGAIWADTRLNGTQALPVSMLATPWMAYTAPDDDADRALTVNLKGDASLASGIRLSGNVYYRRSNTHTLNSNAGEDRNNCIQQGGGPLDCSTAAPSGGTALDLYANNAFAAGTPQNADFVPYAGNLPFHDYTGAIDTSMAISDLWQHSFGGNALLDVDRQILGLDSDLNLGGSFETSAIAYRQNTWLAYLVNYRTLTMPWNFLYGSSTGFEGSPSISGLNVASHNTGANLFLRDTVKPARHLSVTGSLSYSWTRVSLSGANDTWLAPDGEYSWTGADGVTAYYNPAYIGAQYWYTPVAGSSYLATATVPSGAVAGPEVDPVTGAHDYRRVNPAIGFAWNPRDAIGIFASYSEAMRAPTAIELACADPARPCSLPTGFNGDPNLKAVVAHSVEAGARGTLEKRSHWRLNWNGDVYRTILTNDIQFIYTPSGSGYFTNVGKTERQGFDLAVSADLARLHLSASYGYVDATYRSSFIDASGDTVVRGDRIAGVPRQSFKLRAVYAPIEAVALGANLIAVSSQYAHGDEANRYGAVPAYTLVNLDAHIHPLPRLEVFTTLTNLFDRHYASFGVMGTNIYTGNGEQFRTPAAPRAFMLGLRYNFAGQGKKPAAED